MSESKLSSVLPNNTIKDVYPRKPISTLYAENSNNFSTFEDVMYNNDIIMNFASLSPGASNVFRFSRTYQFLGPIICRFTTGIHTVSGASDIKHDYLAYKLIKEIRWTVGGTELLRVSGDSLVPLILDQCESEAKKIRVLKNAGPICDDTGIVFDAANIDISCVLPLPFSTIGVRNFSNLQKPFPLHMLSEPLELQIDFANFDATYMVPSTLTAATLHFQYGKIGNPEQLKKTLYKYPFNSIFSHRYQFTPAGSGVNNITLNGFRKGEVMMIQFYVTLAAAASDNFQGLKLNNIELLFNGQVIWRGGNNDEIWDLCYNNEPCIHGMRPCKTATTFGRVSGFKSASLGDVYEGNAGLGAGNAIVNAALADYYYYYNIPISEILPKYTGLGHSLGADFSKQTISLNISGLTAAAHVLKVAYHYKALYQFDNEQALLVF